MADLTIVTENWLILASFCGAPNSIASVLVKRKPKILTVHRKRHQLNKAFLRTLKGYVLASGKTGSFNLGNWDNHQTHLCNLSHIEMVASNVMKTHGTDNTCRVQGIACYNSSPHKQRTNMYIRVRTCLNTRHHEDQTLNRGNNCSVYFEKCFFSLVRKCFECPLTLSSYHPPYFWCTRQFFYSSELLEQRFLHERSLVVASCKAHGIASGSCDFLCILSRLSKAHVPKRSPWCGVVGSTLNAI